MGANLIAANGPTVNCNGIPRCNDGVDFTSLIALEVGVNVHAKPDLKPPTGTISGILVNGFIPNEKTRPSAAYGLVVNSLTAAPHGAGWDIPLVIADQNSQRGLQIGADAVGGKNVASQTLAFVTKNEAGAPVLSYAYATADGALNLLGAGSGNEVRLGNGSGSIYWATGGASSDNRAIRPIRHLAASVLEPQSGSTVTMADTNEILIIDGDAPLAALTIYLSSCNATYEGRTAQVASSIDVKSVTMGATAGKVRGGLTSLAADTGSTWYCAKGRWFRLR